MGSGPTNSSGDWGGAALNATPTQYQPTVQSFFNAVGAPYSNGPAVPVAPAANSGGLTNGPTDATSPSIASLPNSNPMPQPSGLQTATNSGGLAQNAPDNSTARTNLINALRAMGLIP